MIKKPVLASLSAVALSVLLSACATSANNGGGPGASSAPTEEEGTSPKLTNCTNKMKNDAPQVSVWGWYPNMASVVDNFNDANADVQICWNNVGQGADQYTKVQTAIAAKKGLADVIMLEADRIPSFSIQNALVDLTPYGASEVQGNFSEGAWKDVSQGGKVFAIPVDGGPMAMIYRTDVFEKYGIDTPPTTWDEYKAAAEKVKAAGGPLFGDVGSNVPASFIPLQIQKGAQPFTYDPAKPQDLGVKLNDQASKDVFAYWADLTTRELVGTQDQFTTDYIAGVVNGKYATYTSAAWAPGYLTGAGVGKGKSDGVWAVAPLPQWDTANPVAANWGGSAFAVTDQASNKRLAAIVAKGIYADDASLEEGWKKQIIFPLNKKVLDSPDFQANESDFFSGQTANKDIYIPAAQAYKGTTYPPIATYYYAQMQAMLVKINSGKVSPSEGADQLQADIVKYAKSQGFNVTE